LLLKFPVFVLQFLQLQDLLTHAYKNVPYYTQIFRERGLRPPDIHSFEDMEKLPILTKDIVRKHFKDLTATNAQDIAHSIAHTSGSTGEPLEYCIDGTLSILTHACVQRHWRWCGIEPRELVAVFRGTLINDFGKAQACYWNLEDRQLHFSTFNMTDEVMFEYVKQINKHRPALIRGYPSSLEILACFVDKEGLSISSPRAVHTSSETVSSEQRKIIENAFGAPLFDWYGHGESTVCAGECEKHEGLHLNPEFGYTEFLKTPETEHMDNTFNMVSTSLHNYSMPFIRYDSEDLALLENKQCSCGREMPLVTKLIGRQADIISGPNGVKVSPSSFVHFWKYRVADDLLDIRYAQVVQKSPSRIEMRLVGEKVAKNERVMVGELKQLLGEVDVSFEYLSDVPTGQKWRFTVSEV